MSSSNHYSSVHIPTMHLSLSDFKKLSVGDIVYFKKDIGRVKSIKRWLSVEVIFYDRVEEYVYSELSFKPEK